jgi:hypothetical protein
MPVQEAIHSPEQGIIEVVEVEVVEVEVETHSQSDPEQADCSPGQLAGQLQFAVMVSQVLQGQ